MQFPEEFFYDGVWSEHLWSSNQVNACMDFRIGNVQQPKQIDETVRERCNIKLIVTVLPGCFVLNC